ncbi:MAG: GspE/PulE family protein, partial [Candidatus Falkowbacteria bacterium]
MLTREQQKKLLNLLAEKNLISAKQFLELEKIEDFSKKTLKQILIEKEKVDSEEIANAEAKIFGLSYYSLLNKSVNEMALGIIPIEVAENYKIICFEKDGKNIKVGITDPDNFKAIEAVDFLAKEKGLLAKYFLISDQSLNKAFGQYKSLKKEISSALEKRDEEKKTDEEEIKKQNIEEVIKSAPVAKIVSVIMRHAVEGKASDIHIEPMKKESRVRYRIDGVLHTSLVLPKNIHSAIVARIKVLANLKLDETRIPQDGRIKLDLNDREIDLRVSTLPLAGEEKVVMRILDVSKGAPTLEDLGFFGIGLEIINKNIKKSDGMFLITGPTGSGKSTTLFSVLNIINKEGINISTLEDPVEYQIKGVNQSQVRPEVNFTFASGLRSLLRQDPDVIMVGEIRDSETAELAIHAGLTGHFVLSTLHTNDAIGAIPRILDMGVEPFLLSSTLNTILAQRLARKICQHCKVEQKVPEDVLNSIKEEIKKIPIDLKNCIENFNPGKLIFYIGKGCEYCSNTGYSGRIAISEIIDVNEKIREIIADEKRILKIDDVLNSQKFINMR